MREWGFKMNQKYLGINNNGKKLFKVHFYVYGEPGRRLDMLVGADTKNQAHRVFQAFRMPTHGLSDVITSIKEVKE